MKRLLIIADHSVVIHGIADPLFPLEHDRPIPDAVWSLERLRALSVFGSSDATLTCLRSSRRRPMIQWYAATNICFPQR